MLIPEACSFPDCEKNGVWILKSHRGFDLDGELKEDVNLCEEHYKGFIDFTDIEFLQEFMSWIKP